MSTRREAMLHLAASHNGTLPLGAGAADFAAGGGVRLRGRRENAVCTSYPPEAALAQVVKEDEGHI
jgi:hypothetical protein